MEWDGQNRRIDDRKIAVLEERVKNWMETTTEYRRNLGVKLDVVLEKMANMNDKIAKLPCDARAPMWETVKHNIYALWGVVGIMFIALLHNWIKGK